MAGGTGRVDQGDERLGVAVVAQPAQALQLPEVAPSRQNSPGERL